MEPFLQSARTTEFREPRYRFCSHRAYFEPFRGTCTRRFHRVSSFLLEWQQTRNHTIQPCPWSLIKYFKAEYLDSYLNISVHNLILVKICDSLADIPKIGFDEFLINFFISNFVKQCSPISILEHHVGDLPLGIDTVSKQLDDIWVVQLSMEHYLILC